VLLVSCLLVIDSQRTIGSSKQLGCNLQTDVSGGHVVVGLPLNSSLDTCRPDCGQVKTIELLDLNSVANGDKRQVVEEYKPSDDLRVNVAFLYQMQKLQQS
jgi:hypothetical protein